MRKWLISAAILVLVLVLAGAGGIAGIIWHYGRDLPDYSQLADYQPPMVTRVLANDGRLLAEYATERRIFVPITSIPERVRNAFVAAEDQRFYQHPGVDFSGIVRATIQNIGNYAQNRRPVGASTITQQVAKNFLLTNEVSVARKVKEAILAFRIEKVLSKDRILELYLNEIYLGSGNYGVAAASLNYFNKPLDQLTVSEAAYLAALPKAPNNYNPNQNNDRAVERRNYVVDRMQEEHFVTAEEAQAARAEALKVKRRDPEETVRADYFAEEIRRQLYAKYGENGLYKGGMLVRATVDPKLQALADKSLRGGLIEYDRRHGWRGALEHGAVDDKRLAAFAAPAGSAPWSLAMVTKVDDKGADIIVKGAAPATNSSGNIPMAELTWARPVMPEQKFGPTPKKPADVLQPGDLVLVEPVTEGNGGKVKYPANTYGLRQMPDVSGGFIALDPHTGRVLAMSGGFSYEISQFNRVTQAMRQPGSSFKPFVYMAALDNGFTPASIVLDAPFVVDQGAAGKWKPSNYSEQFYGPTPMRVGIEQSRNLMTVRLAGEVGMPIVADYAKKFGVIDNMQPALSMSLGAGETTLLRMATGYAMIVNGGKRIIPTFVDRIQDRTGKTIFRHDSRDCTDCAAEAYNGQPPPRPADTREQVEDPATTYQMVSILEGVVARGTGQALQSLKRPIAGKTGTTNDFTDGWFIGFTPDLVFATYVGFDNPRTLGTGETGTRAALPIVKNFLTEALAKVPPTPFRVPPGISLVRINRETGQLARPNDPKTILEAFKPGTEPNGEDPEGLAGSPLAPASGTANIGGLY